MSVINTNYLALVSQNNLTKSQSALGTAIERLSSGMRINSAKDDAAGQAIANRFTANIKGLTQAARNANDGISIAQTTEGSLNEINTNLQRIRELSVQAANGSNSQTDLDSIQAEIQERLDEINRVSSETQFNGKYVLGKDADQVMSVQVGAHDNQRIDIKLSRIDATTLNLGSYNVNGTTTGSLTSLDTNKAGAYNKTITGGAVTVDVKDNSFAGATAPPTGSGITAELNGSGDVDLYKVTTSGHAKEGELALKASDGNYYVVTENTSTGQWFWDTSDASTVVAKADLGATPETYTASNSSENTTAAAAGFNNAGAAGAAVRLSTPTIDHSAIDLTADHSFDANAVIASIAYNSTTGTYYAEVTTSDTATQNGYYEVSVDASGVVTFAGSPGDNTAPQGPGNDNYGTGMPAGAAAVTEMAADVEIDFTKGLYARNDVNNAATTNQAGNVLTQKYAAEGKDGNFYEVEATFTYNGSGAEDDIANYTVAYNINVMAGDAVQVSAQNVGAAIDGTTEQLTLAQSGVEQPNQNDLYNLEYTIEVDKSGTSSTGLYGINDANGKATGEYAVLGTDGRYYKADVETDADGNFTGKVSWTTDTSSADYQVIDSTLIAATDVPELVNDDIEVVAHGKYTGLAADQTLVSYQDSKGDTQYLIQTGTGDTATYVKATLGTADATGNIAVSPTLEDGEPVAVTLRSEDPLAALDSALQQVDDLRSHLGAIQNRFESTIANLNNTVNNLSAARSRIEDADYAVEVSNMTRAQILQQAGTSVLAQANQIPQTVLSLLR